MVYTAAGVQNKKIKMIGKYFLHFGYPGLKMSSGRRGSVESYDEKENNSIVTSESFSEEERLLIHDVTQQVERCLTEAKTSILHCRVLLLPHHMTARICQHILRSSDDEPCGFRGAAIRLYVDSRDGPKPIGTIYPDPTVTPTFELSVVFRSEESRPLLRHLFEGNKMLKLRPEYRLVKRKLYSSASPVICDFSL